MTTIHGARKTGRLGPLFATLLLACPLLGCAALGELASLAEVDFAIDRASDGRLAGVEIDRLRSYRDLGPGDLLAITRAVERRQLPLEFVLHLAAENPPDNGVAASLVRLDWTLLLEERETVSGVLDREIRIQPGEVADIPLTIELDLVRFFDDNARDLVDLALAAAGRGGEPKNVKLTARPTVMTPLGPIEYPYPITVTSRRVG